MSDPRSDTEAVTRHPRLQELGRDADEQDRVERFAWDLAAWFAGLPREQLRPLARVVTLVGGAQLRDTRAMCEDLPLLAVEAAARATEALWPWLRDVWSPPEPEVKEEGSDADGGADGDPADVEGEDPGSGGILRDLAGGELDDDLAALERSLTSSPDAAGQLADQVAPAGGAAWAGAKDGEVVARTLQSLVPGMGWGTSPGQLQRALLRNLEPLCRLIDGLPELREIARRLGRMEASDRREQAKEGGSEEVTGVRFSGEVARALPSELALLGDPVTEDLFYLRHAEHQLVSLELTGAGLGGVSSPRRRGPVIAAVDTSGSMRGAPGTVAKAVLLAVARRLVPEGRAVHVLLFGGHGEHKELRLQRGAGGLEEVLELLGWEFGGGTDFDTPLLRALELLRERELREADVLVVTDGMARTTSDVEAAVAVARAGGVRCFTVLIGDDDAWVRGFSDEVHRVAVDGGVLSLVGGIVRGR